MSAIVLRDLKVRFTSQGRAATPARRAGPLVDWRWGRRVLLALASTAILRLVLRTGNVQVAGRPRASLTYGDRLDLNRVPLDLRQGIST